MPHRSSQFTELCSLCDAPADGHCVRCGQIFCKDHAPVADDVRCDDCERGYRERLDGLEDTPSSFVSPLLLLTTAVGVITAAAVGLPWAVVGIAAIGAVGTLGSALGETRDRKNEKLRSSREEVRELRAAFLAERSRLIEPGDA